MRDFETKFKTGEYIHTFHNYEPFYLGEVYGDVKLGGEEQFHNLTGSFHGISGVSWWNKKLLDDLSEHTSILLLDLVRRNKLIHEYIKNNIKKLAELINVDTHLIYRLGNKRIINLMNTINNLRGDPSLSAYIVENDITCYSTISSELVCDVNAYRMDLAAQEQYAEFKRKESEILPNLDYSEIFNF